MSLAMHVAGERISVVESNNLEVSLRNGDNKDNTFAGGQMGHDKRHDQETHRLLDIHGRGRMAQVLCSCSRLQTNTCNVKPFPALVSALSGVKGQCCLFLWILKSFQNSTLTRIGHPISNAQNNILLWLDSKSRGRLVLHPEPKHCLTH